jgi:hypothetical protein
MVWYGGSPQGERRMLEILFGPDEEEVCVEAHVKACEEDRVETMRPVLLRATSSS